MTQVRTRAGKTFDSLEQAFDDRIGDTLRRMGVPTRNEIAKLSRRVETMTSNLLGGSTGSTTRKKSTTKKSGTRKKTTTRKSAAS